MGPTGGRRRCEPLRAAGRYRAILSENRSPLFGMARGGPLSHVGNFAKVTNSSGSNDPQLVFAAKAESSYSYGSFSRRPYFGLSPQSFFDWRRALLGILAAKMRLDARR
jgi:hypothetical protein